MGAISQTTLNFNSTKEAKWIIKALLIEKMGHQSLINLLIKIRGNLNLTKADTMKIIKIKIKAKEIKIILKKVLRLKEEIITRITMI